MSFLDRVIAGLRAQVEIRGDIDRATAGVDKLRDRLYDHEKRLVRLETLVDIARGEFGPLRLPRN